MTKKKKAELAALKAATKKGPKALEKLGVISLQAEMEQYRKDYEKMDGSKDHLDKKEKDRLQDEYGKKKEQIQKDTVEIIETAKRPQKIEMKHYIEYVESSPSREGLSLREEVERSGIQRQRNGLFEDGDFMSLLSSDDDDDDETGKRKKRKKKKKRDK